jgi:hypothetical protein
VGAVVGTAAGTPVTAIRISAIKSVADLGLSAARNHEKGSEEAFERHVKALMAED